MFALVDIIAYVQTLPAAKAVALSSIAAMNSGFFVYTVSSNLAKAKLKIVGRNGRKNEQPKQDKSTLAALGTAVITAIVMFWITSTGDTGNTVTALEPQIEAIQTQLDRNTIWIADWPTNGELAGDVAQNERISKLDEEIKDLEDDIEDLEDEIDMLEERLRDLE